MTALVITVWQLCGAFLTWEIVSRLAGGSAGFEATAAILWLSEGLLWLVERRR
jgi:hypothetical protein